VCPAAWPCVSLAPHVPGGSPTPVCLPAPSMVFSLVRLFPFALPRQDRAAGSASAAPGARKRIWIMAVVAHGRSTRPVVPDILPSHPLRPLHEGFWLKRDSVEPWPVALYLLWAIAQLAGCRGPCALRVRKATAHIARACPSDLAVCPNDLAFCSCASSLKPACHLPLIPPPLRPSPPWRLVVMSMIRMFWLGRSRVILAALAGPSFLPASLGPRHGIV